MPPGLEQKGGVFFRLLSLNDLGGLAHLLKIFGCLTKLWCLLLDLKYNRVAHKDSTKNTQSYPPKSYSRLFFSS